MSALETLIANHHGKLALLLLAVYVLPALLRWCLRKADALEDGSVWDLRIRRLMKLTLDTTSFEEATKKIDAAEATVTAAVEGLIQDKLEAEKRAAEKTP